MSVIVHDSAATAGTPSADSALDSVITSLRQKAAATPNNKPRLIRLAVVLSKVGTGKSALYERIKEGEFPKPVKIGSVSAWVEDEIDAWIAARIAERDAQPGPQ